MFAFPGCFQLELRRVFAQLRRRQQAAVEFQTCSRNSRCRELRQGDRRRQRQLKSGLDGRCQRFFFAVA